MRTAGANEAPTGRPAKNQNGAPDLWQSEEGAGALGAGALNGEALSAGAHSFQNASLGLTGQLIPASNHFCQV